MTTPRRSIDPLLIWAVDLRAIAHNALLTISMDGPGSERYWRKMHALRRAVNRPEHEDIRQEFVKALEAAGQEVGTSADESWGARRHEIDEQFKPHCLHDSTTDCAGHSR